MADENDVRRIAKEEGLTDAQTNKAVKFAQDDSNLTANDAVERAKS